MSISYISTYNRHGFIPSAHPAGLDVLTSTIPLSRATMRSTGKYRSVSIVSAYVARFAYTRSPSVRLLMDAPCFAVASAFSSVVSAAHACRLTRSSTAPFFVSRTPTPRSLVVATVFDAGSPEPARRPPLVGLKEVRRLWLKPREEAD